MTGIYLLFCCSIVPPPCSAHRNPPRAPRPVLFIYTSLSYYLLIGGHTKKELFPSLLKIMLFFESSFCLTNLLWFFKKVFFSTGCWTQSLHMRRSAFGLYTLLIKGELSSLVIRWIKDSAIAGETWTQKGKKLFLFPL